MTDALLSFATLHDRLCALAKSRAALDLELGDVLLEAYRRGLHHSLGYGSFREYVARLFGWTGRQTEERLRVAMALKELPEVRARWQIGELTWSAVRELTRVATTETERAWIEESEGKSARDIERLVSGQARGALPSDAPSQESVRKHVSLNLSARVFALLEEAREQLTKKHGGRVDDDILIEELTARVLAGGSRDAGASAYRITIQTCDRCSHAEQRAGARTVPIAPALVEAARCDAQIDNGKRATQTIPPRIRRQVLERHRQKCAVPGCTHGAFVHIHHITPRAEGGTHDPELLIPLCSAHHAHAHEARLVIRGSATAGFTFEHADGSRYGTKTVSPERAAVAQTVCTTLVSMGFKSGEARAMIDKAGPHVGATPTRDELLRAALRNGEVPRVARAREERSVYQRVAYVPGQRFWAASAITMLSAAGPMPLPRTSSWD